MIGALAHGAAIPVFFLFFGRLLHGFGSNPNNRHQAAHVVSKASPTPFLQLKMIASSTMMMIPEGMGIVGVYVCVCGMLQCALDFLYLVLVVWFASWAGTHSHPTPLSLSLSLFHTHTHTHAHATYTDNQELRMSVVAFVSVIKRKRDIWRSLGTDFWEVASGLGRWVVVGGEGVQKWLAGCKQVRDKQLECG